jgi:7-carboxy-7-deazaguanine synthase
MKIKYSEAFYSIQGEGRWVGTPSVFLRMFGCNFECRGFGQGRDKSKWVPKDQMPHVTDPNRLNYKSYQELPVPKIGCDTSATWSHLYKHIATNEESSVIAQKLLNLTPHKSWNNIHLILTGGEPMLWQKKLPDLLSQKAFEGLEHITIETNSTQKLTPNLKEFLNALNIHITWSCSPKLSISGENWKDAIKPEVVQEYNRVKNSELYLKFVVQNEDDMIEVKTAQHAYGLNVPVYLMPVGGTIEGLELTEKDVAKLALEYGYRFSPRLHVHLFGNAWGT